jgi:hypothetical protein
MSDCELPDFYSERFPAAGKVHVCCELGTHIHIGEQYAYIAGKWAGEFQTYRQSLHGFHLARAANADYGECAVPFGGLDDDLDDHAEYVQRVASHIRRKPDDPPCATVADWEKVISESLAYGGDAPIPLAPIGLIEEVPG